MKVFSTVLRAPDAAEGASTAEMTAILDVFNNRGVIDADLSTPPAPETPEQKKARETAEAAAAAKPGSTESRPTTPEQTAADEATAKAKTARDAALATGKTVDDLATDEALVQLEAEALAARATASGKTIDEQAALEAGEAPDPNAGTEPEFTPEQKTWLDTQKQAAATALAAAKAEAEAAQTKITELEGRLQNADPKGVAVTNLHPLFLVGSSTELEQQEARLSQFENWCIKNWDGTQAVDASADGKTPAQRAFTSEEVRAAYSQTKVQREKILPAARESLAAFAAENIEARKEFPELFDLKNPKGWTTDPAGNRVHSAAIAANVLRIAPGLRVILPNIMTIIGDALAHEKMRKAGKTGKGTSLTAAAIAKAKAAIIKPPVPSPAPSARQIAGKKGSGGVDGISAAAFEENGGDRDALIGLIADTLK